jgi:uncharacterized protein YjbI with pentapeptide repeats
MTNALIKSLIFTLSCFPLGSFASEVLFKSGRCIDSNGAVVTLKDSNTPGQCVRLRYFRDRNAQWERRSFRGMDASHLWIGRGFWSHSNFDSANLREADISFLTAKHVDFHGAILRGARFRDVFIEHTDAAGAQMQGVRFFGVRWLGGDLRFSRWKRAWIQDSQLADLDLRGADLSGVMWVNSRCLRCRIDQDFPGAGDLGFKLE